MNLTRSDSRSACDHIHAFRMLVMTVGSARTVTLPRRGDTTIAHKVINLMAELSVSDKRVAGAIIDHFNRKTGQCDPSLERIGGILGVNRRTVIRSVHRLERFGLFLKCRHGGRFNRNSYEPVWAAFRTIEAAWKVRFGANKERSCATKLSPVQCQPCHVSGVSPVTQTFLSNHSKVTSPDGSTATGHAAPNEPRGRKCHSGQESGQELAAIVPGPKARSIRPIEAARAAAERRWATALNDRYRARPTVYSAILEAIDSAMQNAATEAELRERGAGLVHILEQLRSRNMRISE